MIGITAFACLFLDDYFVTYDVHLQGSVTTSHFSLIRHVRYKSSYPVHGQRKRSVNVKTRRSDYVYDGCDLEDDSLSKSRNEKFI